MEELALSNAIELGWKHIRPIDQEEAKAELMRYFNVISEPAWIRRLRGVVKIDREEAKDVEAIFEKYGVEPSQIWGRYEP